MEMVSDSSVRAAELRGELKAWEKEFATANDGRKAGREDIRANATIASKYKEYNKLRDIISGKQPASQPLVSPSKSQAQHQQQRKRKAHHHEAPATPSKRIATTKTTSSSQHLQMTPSQHPEATPSSRLPRIIGPTPQKDGLVLGLFDLLPAETPSRRGQQQRSVLGDIEANMAVAQTPTKTEALLDGRLRGSRTPMSAGKRAFLDRFATPVKKSSWGFGGPLGDVGERVDEEDEEGIGKGHSTTPVFLRRDAVEVSVEAGEANGEGRIKRPPFGRRGLVRSLSSMIQRAKKQEEDRLDEELDILREMEAGAEGGPPAKKTVPATLVQDSQAAEMPLGADGDVQSEDDEDDAARNAAPGDQSRKPWKKRGQKRQTRLFKMRPVRTKPDSEPESEEDLSEDDLAAGGVADSQIPTAPGGDDEAYGGASDKDKDDEGSDYDSDASHSEKKRKTKSSKLAKAGVGSKEPPGKAAKSEGGTIRKTVRKLNEQAHANYRRLKIKSKNPKGNGGRFGRGRR